MNTILDILTDKQREVATFKDSHTRLVACPGSGKTTTLLGHIYYLLEKCDADAKRILVLAFNRTVADKLENDLKNKCGLVEERMPVIATLHGYALKLIYKYQLVKDIGKTGFPYEDIDNLQVDEKRCIIEPFIRAHLSKHGIKVHWKSYDKTFWRPYAHHFWYGNQQTLDDKIMKFHEELQKAKTFFSMCFLGELPNELKTLLKNNEDIKKENPFDQILIDEFQDLNPLDRALIKIISEMGSRVFVAGDDFQSVYSFRGADPKGLLEFHKIYKNTKHFELEESFRCPRTIIEYSKKIISHHPNPLDRKFEPLGKLKGTVKQLYYKSDKSECETIAHVIKHYMDNCKAEIIVDTSTKITKSVLLILSKKDLIEKYKNELDKLKVDFLCDKKMLHNNTIWLLWILLRFFCNNDQLALYQLIRLKCKNWNALMNEIYKNEDCTESLENTLVKSFPIYKSKNKKLWLVCKESEEIYNTLLKIKGDLDSSSDILEQVKFIIFESKKIYSELDNDTMETFLQQAKETIEKNSEFAKGIEYFGWLMNDLIFEKLLQQETPIVRIETLRRAKGLEADLVIIASAEDNIVPGDKEPKDEQIRLLYVGATRSQRFLFTSYARNRIKKRFSSGHQSIWKEPSQFLPKEQPFAFEKGEDFLESTIKNNTKYWDRL